MQFVTVYGALAVGRVTVRVIKLDVFPTAGGGTAAAAPPPFMPSEPALCGGCPLVTPYYCRLGDLLCLFV